MTALIDAAASPADADVDTTTAPPPDASPPATPDAGSDVLDPADADSGPSLEFRRIYSTILRPTCGGAGRFCHANELESTKLDFNTVDKAFANLVNVPTALTCAAAQGWLRVVPFDPKASAVMSVRGDFCNFRHGSFSNAGKVDLAPIEAWILGGAR